MKKPSNGTLRLKWITFRISTLFVMLGVVCVAFALAARRYDYAKRQSCVVAAVMTGVNRPKTTDNEVSYDYEFDASGEWIKNAEPKWPDFLMRTVGKDFLCAIEEVLVTSTQLDDEVLEQIGHLSALRVVVLTGCDISSDDLKHFQDLRNVEYLDLMFHQIGDSRLAELSMMTELKHLELGYPEVGCELTDASLRDLAGLQELEYLGLIHNAITDAGIESIGRLRNLKRVALLRTQVTEDGAAKLRKLLPNCKVAVGD